MASSRGDLGNDSDDEDEWPEMHGVDQPPFGLIVLLMQAEVHYRDKNYVHAMMLLTGAAAHFQGTRMYNPILWCRILYKRARCFLEMGDRTKATGDLGAIGHDMSIIGCALKFYKLQIEIEERFGNIAFTLSLSAIARHAFPKSSAIKAALKRNKHKLKKFIQQSDQGSLYQSLHLMMSTAKLYEDGGEISLATAVYTEVISIFYYLSIEKAYLRRGTCYLKMGKLEEAEDDCAEILRQRPHSEAARSLHSNIIKAKKEKQKDTEATAAPVKRQKIQDGSDDNKSSTTSRAKEEKEKPPQKYEKTKKTKKERKAEKTKEWQKELEVKNICEEISSNINEGPSTKQVSI